MIEKYISLFIHATRKNKYVIICISLNVSLCFISLNCSKQKSCKNKNDLCASVYHQYSLYFD